MGRIRTVKPELFTHADLFDAEQETGLPLRLAFAGLWTCCDREGRFKWRPRELKIAVLPFDELDFSRVLDALATRGFLVKYAIRGEAFGCVPTWKRHQFINNREMPSQIPEPTSNLILDASVTRDPHEDDATGTDVVKEGERKGTGRGKESWSSEPTLPDTVDTRILCEGVGIFRTRDQEEMHRCYAAFCKSSGRSVEGAREHMKSRWEEFQASAPQMEWQWGSAHGFFMSGKWDEPHSWPRGKQAQLEATYSEFLKGA